MTYLFFSTKLFESSFYVDWVDRDSGLLHKTRQIQGIRGKSSQGITNVWAPWNWKNFDGSSSCRRSSSCVLVFECLRICGNVCWIGSVKGQGPFQTGICFLSPHFGKALSHPYLSFPLQTKIIENNSAVPAKEMPYNLILTGRFDPLLLALKFFLQLWKMTPNLGHSKRFELHVVMLHALYSMTFWCQYHCKWVQEYSWHVTAWLPQLVSLIDHLNYLTHPYQSSSKSSHCPSSRLAKYVKIKYSAFCIYVFHDSFDGGQVLFLKRPDIGVLWLMLAMHTSLNFCSTCSKTLELNWNV